MSLSEQFQAARVWVASKQRAFRIAKLVLAWFLALYLVVGLSVVSDLEPVPERFPEASTAFLYSSFSGSRLATFFAIFGFCLGTPFRVLLRYYQRHAAEEADDDSGPRIGTSRMEGVVFLCFAMAWLGALAAVPLMVLETRSYTALTDSGIVNRDYWGWVERRPWSALQLLELHCSDNGNPILTLHFEGGHASNTILDMRPYRATKEEALDRLERLRRGNGAPLVWRQPGQQAAFRNRSDEITRCVDTLLRQFPLESRGELSSQLASNALRSETLASYR